MTHRSLGACAPKRSGAQGRRRGWFLGTTGLPVGLHPKFQKQGIGSKLIRQGLERCRNLGYKVVIVVGHPNYYPRFGFTSARAKGLETPFLVPDEAFMVIEVAPGALNGISGMVIYPPAFEGV